MFNRAKLLILLVLLYAFSAAPRNDLQTRKVSSRPEAALTPLLQTYSNLPMSFERNQGQTDESVKFISRGRGYSLFLTPTEAVLTSSKGSQSKVLWLQLTGSNSMPR